MFLQETLLLTLAFLPSNALRHNFKKPRINGKIIGGDVTTIKEHPWQASLQIFGFHNCGASIIGKNTLVTAAHCINGLTAFLHTAVVGTENLNEVGERYSIESVKLHENFSNPNNDIAIVKLNRNLIFSETIQPIKLPNGKELAVGTEVNVTGWGLTNEDDRTISNELRSVIVEIIDREKCKKSYSQFIEVTEQMICAGVLGGRKDACYGDSGGPLSRNDVLYGVVSWGIGCGEPDHPGVFTNIVNFVEWIKNNANL